MRASLLLLIFLSAVSFTYNCKPVSVIDATKRTWVSGAPGGKSGTAYTIKLLVKGKQKAEFPNVWLGEKGAAFQAEPATGDTVVLTYNRINGEIEETAKRVPVPYEGEALVECVLNGKAQYLPVKSFRKLDSLKGE